MFEKYDEFNKKLNDIAFEKIEDEKTITLLGLNESAARLIKPKSVLIAITGATCGNIGLLEFEASANQSVIAIEPLNNFDYRYLFYYLLMKRNDILSNQTGSAQGGVNLNSIKKLDASFPSPEEQTRIATILSDMDAGIAALEKQLAKARSIKQGMMQQLLTGKIRLV
jgi:type I restriction enzyme S subunit